MSGLSIRLTHKVMAIGLFGLVGLAAFGAIYEICLLYTSPSPRD